MAHFVEGGTMTFDALTYGGPHPGTLNFLSQQFQNVTPVLAAAGQQFVQQAADWFEQLNGSAALRAMKSAARAVKSLWQLDDVRPLLTVGQMQFAPPTMQRWIMAEPTIRTMYHKHMVDGYSDSYVDFHPGDVGEDHYDYRRVMDGVVQFAKDDNAAYVWKAVEFLDELEDNDQPLTLEEQIDIQQTWEFMRAHLKRSKEDPTSIYCNEI